MVGVLARTWAKMSQFMDHFFWAKNGSKNGDMLRNVVFEEAGAKMTQKQHIGNFQI